MMIRLTKIILNSIRLFLFKQIFTNQNLHKLIIILVSYEKNLYDLFSINNLNYLKMMNNLGSI